MLQVVPCSLYGYWHQNNIHDATWVSFQYCFFIELFLLECQHYVLYSKLAFLSLHQAVSSILEVFLYWQWTPDREYTVSSQLCPWMTFQDTPCLFLFLLQL